MSFHRYQITFDTTGKIERIVQLPDEPVARKKTIIVTEETERAARRKAEELYTFAT